MSIYFLVRVTIRAAVNSSACQPKRRDGFKTMLHDSMEGKVQTVIQR